jgi:tetratricopeptide (TPR) repeat protein
LQNTQKVDPLDICLVARMLTCCPSSAVDADPKSSTYRSNRAAAYMSAGKYVQALDDCKEADELDPNNAKILHRMARVYTSLGRPKEALETYDRITPAASQKDRQPAVTMNKHLSEAEEQIRDSTSGSMAIYALDQAEKGLGSTVTRPRKWALLRGEAYLKMGNVNALGDAQNIAMSLLRNNSADPEALVLRGRALYAQGENDKALQHFRQAISCDPDYKDAVKYLRMVQKLDRTKEEGNGYFKSGKYQQAVDTYTSALEIDPQNRGTNSKILQNRALCYTKVYSRIATSQISSNLMMCVAQGMAKSNRGLRARTKARPQLHQGTQDKGQSTGRVRRLGTGRQGTKSHCRKQPRRTRHRKGNPQRRARTQEEQTQGLLQDSRG